MAVSPTDRTDRPLHELLEGMRFAMVATPSPDGISSRPLTLLEHEDRVLRFLVSSESSWVAGLEPTFVAHAAFADPDHETYVGVSGSATITKDRSLIDRLWNPAAAASFDGKDDPAVAVLELTATGGEWWDGPSSKVGQVLSIVLTKVRGRTDDDEHGRIAVD
jgi:general stress protein 26